VPKQIIEDDSTFGVDPDFEAKLDKLYTAKKRFLLAKHKKYGMSALKPLGIFSKDNKDDIEVRIDDKLARVKHSKKLRKNDTVDLSGYLDLLMIREEWDDFDEFID